MGLKLIHTGALATVAAGVMFLSPRPATAQTAASSKQARQFADVEARVERLQQRIDRLEAIREIQRVQYAYGHYTEFGLWNDFAELFTDDAITNYQQGVRGKEQIRKLFFDQVGQGKLGLADGRIYPHILFQPVITLAPDGRSAKGRWRILAMLGGYGGSATWYSGVYENEYVFEPTAKGGGAWKISVLRSEPKATAAYTAAGWKDSGAHIPFHYTAAGISGAGVLTTIAASVTGGAKVDERTALASLSVQASRLSQRAGLLNDQAEVTNLQDAYGKAMDRRQWDEVAEMFANNGTLELGQQGVYAGRASIRRALDQFGPQATQAANDGAINDHVYLQTLVTVEPGGTAKARGVEIGFAGGPGGGELTEGIFENSFVKSNGRWQIQAVQFYPRMIVDSAVGWAKSAKPAPGPSKEYPPDRPPTAAYEIYPRFTVAPFHFANPVTGEAPQYPEGYIARKFPFAGALPDYRGPQFHSVSESAAYIANIERQVGVAEAYEAAEKMIDANGYYLDESPSEANGLFVQRGRAAAKGTVFVHQVLQPVIDVAPDGQSAKVRARGLNLGGTSGGPGYWSAGSWEGEIVLRQGSWKFQAMKFGPRWTAAYPGGWGRVP